MATVLDLVKHYQHAIEKYPNDEQKILKSIDKLFNLDVTVQHLQDTGVGRTVNALRKEPGNVGQAARALVCKWKLMVAAEESDQDGDQNPDTKKYNGYDNERHSDDNVKRNSRNQQDHEEKSISRTEYKNGNHSGSKRKYHSSEEEEPDPKKSKSSNSSYRNDQKTNIKIKKESSESGTDDSDQSCSDSDVSEYSEEEQETKLKHKIKQETSEHHKSKHSSNKNHSDHKKESSSSKKPHNSDKHDKNRHHDEKTSSEKSTTKDKSQTSHKPKSSKDKDVSTEKHSKSEHNSSEKEKHKEETSSSKHRSSSDKHKSSKLDISNEKHNSNTDKHSDKTEKSRSSSNSHKSDKDKNKSSSRKETSVEKDKSKESHSSKEKHSSSSKERSKDRSSSSKEKSEHSHKSEKKHSTNDSKDSKTKHSESKDKSGRKDGCSSESKSKHKSNSSSHSSKSSKDKLKEDIPKKKSDSSADSDDGINCESGASFAEALGMISPAKPKKKAKIQSVVSPNLSNSADLSPAVLLAPNAKLTPLPALEISALPEISPNYKPRPPPKFLPHFTDEEAMSAVISSKNQRTKVYSGNKVIGKISTLYEMCVQVLQEHIDALEYTGGVPYDILKPVVDKATPQQLFMLEHYNPYLMDDTDHLWQNFCQKHFRSKQRQEMETWREMYMRCQEEQEHRLKSLTANIKIAQEKAKAPIKQTKMAYVDTVVKPPRNIARKQALHGTAHAAAASPAARVASLAAAPNVLRGNARPSPAAPAPFAHNNKPKKAPLMQKALQFMRGRKR